MTVDRFGGEAGDHANNSLNSARERRHKVDGGWGWVVTGCSFLLQMMSAGLSLSSGVFFQEFLGAFQEERGATALVNSLNTGLLFGAGPLASVLTNFLGHRAVIMLGGVLCTVGLFASAFATSIYTLYITFGIITGIGFSLVYIPSVVVVGLYFERKRAFAISLAVTGVGAGCLIFPPLVRLLIEISNWRNALVGVSAITAHCLVFGALLWPVPAQTPATPIYRIKASLLKAEEANEGSNAEKFSWSKLFNFSLLLDIKFAIFFLNNVLFNVGSLILFVIVTDYAHEHSVTNMRAAWVVSAIGISNTAGRLLSVVVGGHKNANRLVLYMVANTFAGLAIVLFPTSRAYFAMMCYAVAHGVSFGCQLGLLATVAAELFSVSNMSSAYGYLMFGNGLGALSGPPLAGWIFTETNNYDIAFYLGGGIYVFSACLLIIIVYIQRKAKQHPVHNKDRVRETVVKSPLMDGHDNQRV